MTIARVKAITGENNPSARAVICVETGVRYSLAKDATAGCWTKIFNNYLEMLQGDSEKSRWIYMDIRINGWTVE